MFQRGCDRIYSGITVFLVLAVIFVNGATDAPNSIAGAVGSGALKYRSACLLCALFELLGLAVAGTLFPAVSESILDISTGGVTAVPLLTVVLFALAAWRFGIPTSESHALVAALGGVSLYCNGRLTGSFIDVCIKSAVSCIAGLGAGALFVLLFSLIRKNVKLSFGKRDRSLYQGALAALSSACHGMQDGQKFTAMLIPAAASGTLPIGAVVICSAVMGAGCLAGGRRIAKKLGEEMTSPSGLDSAAADTGALTCTLASTVLGIPVSTTYMKTCSMLGAALPLKRKINGRVVLELILTWAATYPVCMLLSYCLCAVTELFL